VSGKWAFQNGLFPQRALFTFFHGLSEALKMSQKAEHETNTEYLHRPDKIYQGQPLKYGGSFKHIFTKLIKIRILVVDERLQPSRMPTSR
jgi:hypothetical protein